MQKTLFLLTCSLLLWSCGNSADNQAFTPLSGKVTYQGQPVLDGVIRLIPAQGTQAPVRTTQIKSGQYQFAERNALKSGTYQVEIQAYRGGSRLPGDKTANSPEREQILPDKYNKQTEIEALTIQPDDHEMQKDFNLN